MPKFMVVGGSYADTRFERLAEGAVEQRFGPFDTYEAAKAEWARRTWEQVDDATARFRIEEVQEGEETQSFFVVGGIYTSTSFLQIAGGGRETWFGPFPSYEDARREWSNLAFKTVDDALARYRIERRRPSQVPG